MIVAAVAKLAASAAVLTLGAGSARNILQTVRTVRKTQASGMTLEDRLQDNVLTSSECLVDHLQTLSREELLELFCLSRPPDNLPEISGDWNGVLLKNNGLWMTSVGSKFMTNALFAIGRGDWNGKAFGSSGKGINRFNTKENDMIVTEHSFDFSLNDSRLQQGAMSVCLRYSNYQSSLSPWYTMVDEIRCLNDEVMIGFGSMWWSGGMMNSAPFCLHRSRCVDSMQERNS